MKSLMLPLVFGASSVIAQVYTNGSVPTTTTMNSTGIVNGSLFATTVDLSVEDMWDEFIGPVEFAAVTTTVAATPVPTSQLVPPPPLYYSSFPMGAQNPMVYKNSSWKFPKNFWWGVASAAYQVEGAAKAEGRGPSIWDKLTRIPGNTVANQTGDIADNQYYLYKQDIFRIAALGPYISQFTLH